MKKSIALATLAAASITTLASLSALSGCNKSSSFSATGQVLGSIMAQTGASIRLTTFEYNQKGQRSRETQTLNGTLVYTISDYDYSSANPFVRYRTSYDAGGGIVKHKLSSTYKTVGSLRTTTTETTLDGSNTPVETETEVMDISYSQGRNMGYKLVSNDKTVVERTNYDYSGSYSSRPTVTYDETRADGTTYKMSLVYTDANLLGYELHQGEGTLSEATLVEERTGFSSSGMSMSYKIIDYRGTAPVTTNYTHTNITITVVE